MGQKIKALFKKTKLSQQHLKFGFPLLFGVIGVALTHSLLAAAPAVPVEPETGTLSGNVSTNISTQASGGSYVKFGQGNTTQTLYAQNLAKINAQPWRNTMQDDSQYADWPMSRIDQDVSVLFGPKKDYADGRFAEESLDADPINGNMRIGCEFSHFAYDDPILYPGQPEVAHLHMFFGNTDTNAYTTNKSLRDSGSSTCNGGELDRTAYWVPAMFDDKGNVRVPMFMNIYYKNDNMNNGSRIQNGQTKVEPFPDGARIIASRIPYANNTKSGDIASTESVSFMCIGEFGGDQSARVRHLNDLQTEVDHNRCKRGDNYYGANHTFPEKRYLEHNVLFQNCWNGQDPSDINNFTVSRYANPATLNSRLGFFGGTCPPPFLHRLPDTWYRIRYILEADDNPSKWYLSSDVDRSTLQRNEIGGITNHGDWWNGWNAAVNKTWVDKCANIQGESCGFGYLDGKTLNEAPDGPALVYRHKNVYKTSDFTPSDYKCDTLNSASYLCNLKSVPNNYGCQRVLLDMNPDVNGQSRDFCSIDKIPAQDVFNSLCSAAYTLQRSSQAAYCKNPQAQSSQTTNSAMPGMSM